MSGGSYNYIYIRLLEECENSMYDAEMNDLINDLCEVLHDLEWWQSCDTSEESYRKTLTKFKKKWFKGNREERLKGYIDQQVAIVKKQLYDLISSEKGESMTREEAISFLEVDKQYQDIKDYRDALDIAIKALEQEPVLDKIRAEIMSKDGLEEALEIIDKYKAESRE